MQVSTVCPEFRSLSPERPAKRRCHNDLPAPLRNGDMPTPTAAHSGQATSSVFAASPSQGAFTPPALNSPRSFGDSREYLSLLLSKALTYNRSRAPRNPIMLSAGANRHSRVPCIPQLQDLDWRARPGTWPKAARDETSGEETESIAVTRRTNSNPW